MHHMLATHGHNLELLLKLRFITVAALCSTRSCRGDAAAALLGQDRARRRRSLYLRLRSIPTQDPTMNQLFFSVPSSHRRAEQWMHGGRRTRSTPKRQARAAGVDMDAIPLPTCTIVPASVRQADLHKRRRLETIDSDVNRDRRVYRG